MDCEMVGLGPFSFESGLARCSLVDYHGAVLYDKFIRPEGEITNYRTPVSGITPRHMEGATPFAVARLEVSEGPFASQIKGDCRLPPLYTHTRARAFVASSPGARSVTYVPSGVRFLANPAWGGPGYRETCCCLHHIPEKTS